MQTQDPNSQQASQPAILAGQAQDAAWVVNVALLWAHRRLLLRVAGLMFVLSLALMLVSPNHYQSTARIMPPQQTGTSAAMLAALAGRGAASGSLAGLAGGLLGGRSNGALFVDLLRSGTVGGHLIDHFQLQHVYGKRYVQDTAKKLASRTTIAEDTKSGVITIVVEDTDRQRARDMAQAYVDELNDLVAKVNTSSARREREFIEQRLPTVQRELQQAQMDMAAYSTRNTAIDIREQTRAMVDSGSRLQGQLVASEAELDSLQQIYGGENVRVRAATARVALMRQELARASGGGAAGEPVDETHPYPALRQLPALAVPWANLYRKVRIQETVLEMLSAQYETARIEEAKDIPTVSEIDAPGLPEKKSSPHRLTVVVLATLFGLVAASLFLLARRSWLAIDGGDTRRVMAREMAASVTSLSSRIRRRSA